MDTGLVFIAGALVGGMIVWLFVEMRAAWQRGSGLLKAPDKARAESAKARQKARDDVSKGRRELGRALVTLLLLALTLAVVVYGVALLYSI